MCRYYFNIFFYQDSTFSLLTHDDMIHFYLLIDYSNLTNNYDLIIFTDFFILQ